LPSESSQRSLKFAADEHTSFMAAILLFYESAFGSKELEHDRERTWRWRDWSRAFLQERSLTKLAPCFRRLKWNAESGHHNQGLF